MEHEKAAIKEQLIRNVIPADGILRPSGYVVTRSLSFFASKGNVKFSNSPMPEQKLAAKQDFHTLEKRT